LNYNIIKFGHDGPQMSYQRACWKGYNGENVPRWNLEVESFVARWVVQMEEDMHGLGVVEDHMPPWGVISKEMCCCQLVPRLQKGSDIDQP
jgi:hypothetical protein